MLGFRLVSHKKYQSTSSIVIDYSEKKNDFQNELGFYEKPKCHNAID